MLRTLLVCVVLLVPPLHVPAQKVVEPTETVIRLTLQPMAAPKPALKYQLLPELKEMNPGNPVQEYMKCFAEQQNFFFNRQMLDDRERYQVMPLHELPLEDIRYYCGRGPLKQADYAARLDTPNWQILPRIKTEGFATLLPDIQQLRMLASALKVRFRIEVAENRFEDAITTAKTMLALSRHLGEHPTLVGELVGFAIANLAIGPLEEMLQQPGCPNLYWALTDLPSPFINLRNGLQADRIMLDPVFAGFDLTVPLSEADLKKLLTQAQEAVQIAAGGKVDVKAWMKLIDDPKYVAAARHRLVKSALKNERVQDFPALQVILLDGKRAFEERRDERLKLMMLPYRQAEAGFFATPPADEPAGQLLDGLQIAPFKVRKAQARLEQRIALLRHVEAIRLYAAEHDGKLPPSLNDVTVPLPVDPITGQPFRYSVDGPLAEVRGSPPRGEETSAAYNVRYVVTIKK